MDRQETIDALIAAAHGVLHHDADTKDYQRNADALAPRFQRILDSYRRDLTKQWKSRAARQAPKTVVVCDCGAGRNI